MKQSRNGWTSEEMVARYDYLTTNAFLYGPVQLAPTMERGWSEHLAQIDPRWTNVMAALRGIQRPHEASIDFQRCLRVSTPGSYVLPYASVYLDTPPPNSGTDFAPNLAHDPSPEPIATVCHAAEGSRRQCLLSCTGTLEHCLDSSDVRWDRWGVHATRMGNRGRTGNVKNTVQGNLGKENAISSWMIY